jgi:hypothetical protein
MEKPSMHVEVHNCYSPAGTEMDSPVRLVKFQLEQTDWFLKYLRELRPDVEVVYVVALLKRIQEDIGDARVEYTTLALDEFLKNLHNLNKHEGLRDAVITWVMKRIEAPEDYTPEKGDIKILGLNMARVYDLISYYRVKTLTILLGEDEGVAVFKKILSRIVSQETDERVTDPRRKEFSFKAYRRRNIDRFAERQMGDFTVAFLDDHSTLYRFDKCITHEVLKDLNDPDIAYLASCYIGDIKEYNEHRRVKLRRTQTLHQGDFCDELYWDSQVHENPKQPSLEFTRGLGKKKEES